MRAGELESIGRLSGAAVALPAVAVRDVHRAVSSRVFGMLGPLGAPVRFVHDGIASAAYAGTGVALRSPVGSVAKAAARRVAPDAHSMADNPAGAFVLGALNGMWGDRMARDLPALALPMTIRIDGPHTGKLAVFVHGLCENDDSWRGGYGGRLRADLGYTPLYVRYNTGLRVCDNGRRLAAMIDDLVANWPVKVDEIILVGHSMGGLVSRSACHYAEADGHAWTDRLGTSSASAPRTWEHRSKRRPRAPEPRSCGCPRRARSAARSKRAAPASRTCASATASRTTRTCRSCRRRPTTTWARL